MPIDLDKRIETWRTQLLDTTKRNRLINFKSGGTGGIALIHPKPGTLWGSLLTSTSTPFFVWKRDLVELPSAPERDGSLTLFDPVAMNEATDDEKGILEQCLECPRLRENHLLTELSDDKLAKKLTRLDLNARESLTEQGVATLFVAFGFLRWFESPDSEIEIRSPLLLVPVRLERDNVEAPWKLIAEDEEILPNHSLAHLMASTYRVRLPIPDDDPANVDDPTWRTRYLAEIQKAVAEISGWKIIDEVALGTFKFQKLAMWEDLGRNRAQILAHDLCRAVAGDRTVALASSSDLPMAKELDDKTHPQTTFHILDADSSQHEAIATAVGGASFVLDGPPGTGKSQTIANVIAEFLAGGKTVLFVSEKAAALEVVQRRLQARGLDDFVLACHSHKANKREIVAELGRCLNLGPEGQSNLGDDLQRLYDARHHLNQYVRELHTVRRPLGKTVFQVHGDLSRLAGKGYLSRCPVPKILERDAAYLRFVDDLLARLPDCRKVIEEPNHPWRGCRAKVFSQTLRDEVCHHFGRLASGFGKFREVNAVFHKLGLSTVDPTWVEWQGLLKQTRAILACPLVPAKWFDNDARATAEAFVQLDQLTVIYRQMISALPEFELNAIRQVAKPLTLVAETSIVKRPGETLRHQCKRVVGIRESLGKLHERVVAVENAAQKIANVLHILTSAPVKALRRFAELAELIASTKTIRTSWWDAGRRKELLNVVLRGSQEAKAAQDSRAEMADRLAPVAFAMESAEIASKAAWYDNFLKRLWPTWWHVKAEVLAWYVGDAPSTNDLLRDLKSLFSYHKRIAFCHQVRQQYAADILVDADGRPAWAATLSALESVDSLEEYGKIPSRIQLALSEEGDLDRRSLGTAGRMLNKEFTALCEIMEAMAKDYDFGEITEGTSRKVRLSPCELIAWLEKKTQAVERMLRDSQELVRLLAGGGDLLAESVPTQLKVIGELVRVRAQIGPVCARIWPSERPKDIENQNWSTMRRLAEAFLALTNQKKAGLSRAEVKALTDAKIRATLTEEIGRYDAAYAAGFADSWQFLQGVFDITNEVSTRIVIERAPLTSLQRWLTERSSDAQRIHEWTQFCEIAREVSASDVGAILQEVQRGELKPEDAGEAFRARFLRLWLDAIYELIPAIRQFGSDNHERLIDRFQELDNSSVASASSRIRAGQLGRADRPRIGTGDAPGSSELGTLLREVNKKRCHLPLRKLFAAIPTVLPRLKPCMMMSPLAVSTFLNSPDIRFDLVIFDEASQVRPHDAICAVYRGRQLIVAGDQKQLPPTSFFDRTAEDEGNTADEVDGVGALEDFESILDVCCTLGLPPRRLRWHYRSRREGLIAFANHHIYGNELVTFPSVHDVAGNSAIDFEFVPDGRWKAGTSGGFNGIEARRTAELVLDHFRNQPEQSLGVIAFSQRQQMRILDELEQLRQANPDLEQFFHEDYQEPFFIKNLENVQGDERDVIFLSIGYGPDDSGRVAMRFGPLNRQGGERRLNVAVTRARYHMKVVSSMRSRDIDLSRTGAVGVKLLRAYLDYAERGMDALRGTITGVNERRFESPFEQNVYEELTQRGLTLHTQVGCSKFHIDLAVVDPQEPGRYLLGIECDGASYHSSATARDRDRLRQEVLEGLGWWICRIWSTDWLKDRERQIQRVLGALETSRREGAPRQQKQQQIPQRRPIQVATNMEPKPLTPALSFDSIDDVPESILRDIVCNTLREFGATESSELTQTVSRRLGFKRTGNLIQTRIEKCVKKLIQAETIVVMADQRLQLAQHAASG